MTHQAEVNSGLLRALSDVDCAKSVKAADFRPQHSQFSSERPEISRHAQYMQQVQLWAIKNR